MSDFERYEHSVLDVSSQLVGFISGTFSGLAQDQMYVRAVLPGELRIRRSVESRANLSRPGTLGAATI
jgi:hypothetical protein